MYYEQDGIESLESLSRVPEDVFSGTQCLRDLTPLYLELFCDIFSREFSDVSSVHLSSSSENDGPIPGLARGEVNIRFGNCRIPPSCQRFNDRIPRLALDRRRRPRQPPLRRERC